MNFISFIIKFKKFEIHNYGHNIGDLRDVLSRQSLRLSNMVLMILT